MTLDQLRIFIAVAERQHVTQAARALNIAQSAASSAIAALEVYYDTKLFDRIGRHIELTEAGNVFLVEARSVVARAERAELVLSEFGSLKRGVLAVQASQTIASYWLPRHLVCFRHSYPHIEIRLGVGNTVQVTHAVENGTAELGFVEGTVEDGKFLTKPIARDQLVIVVAPSHCWAKSKSMDINSLLEGDWVLREPGSGTRAMFEEVVRRARPNGRLRIALELPSNEAVRAAVEAGMGATAISASVAAPSIEAGLLSAVPFPLPERRFYILMHRERAISRAARELLSIVKKA